MPITPLPTPPLRSDGPTTFADRGDTFMAALPAFVTQANALEANVDALEASAVASATDAALSASSAVAAANFKGEYAAGTTYQVGHSTSYLGDTWFAKTVNTGVTPVTGAAWQRVVAIPTQTGQSGKVLTTDGSNPSWSGSFASLDSPALTGTPTAPTATVGTNTTQLATTAFVQAEKVSLPAFTAF